MDALEAIFTRRSVRQFTDQPVEKDKIATLLQAAMAAPSTANQQPWHFVVITKRELLDKIPTVHPYAKMCLQAQAVIMPCVDLELDKHKGFWVQDLSNAAENILLAARALDLGAVWLGVYPRKDRMQGLQQLFELPSSIVPFNLIPLGYTKLEQQPADRYKEERVHWDQW